MTAITYPVPQGIKPRLEYHAPDTLIVDLRYQRGTGSSRSQALIKSILDGWNWNYFGVILATDNGDGTYCVIDGQHRAEAARQHPAVHAVPVMVIDEMTLAEQAQAFTAINEARVRLNALQIHKAKVIAGDPAARAIADICTAVAVTVPANIPSGGATAPGELICIGTLYRIYGRDGGPALIRALRICMAAYAESAGDLRAQIIQAVNLACLSTDAADDAISARLATRVSDEWLLAARQAGGKTVPTLARMLAGIGEVN